MYTYTIVIKRWIDGDSAIIDIDLGFDIWLKNQRLRIRNVNTPELHPRYAEYTLPDGTIDEESRNAEITMATEALNFVNTLAPPESTWIGETFKATPDNFGRWLLDFKVNGMLISKQIDDAGYSN